MALVDFPNQEELDGLLVFTHEDFESHCTLNASWLSAAGKQVAAHKDLIRRKEKTIDRRRAQITQAALKANAGKGYKDPTYLSKDMIGIDVTMDRAIVQLENELLDLQMELDRLNLELYEPMRSKKEMLMVFSGQMRVEKEAYNQERNRKS